jgi:hypothetical protein
MRTLLSLLIIAVATHYSSGQSRLGPAICLEGFKYNDTISIDQMSNVMRLKVCNDTAGDLTINAFRMTRYGKGLDPVTKSYEGGNSLPGDMLSVLLSSPPNSKILFEYVTAVRKDGRVVNVGTLALTKR